MIAALCVLGALVLIVLGVGWFFSRIILYSRRQPITRTPADHGLEYEDVEFRSVDGLLLKGWFIPAGVRSRGVVVVTHPFPFNRHGFVAKGQGFPPLSHTDVDLLKTVKAVERAGLSVLAFDFRNHGESESGRTNIGLTEYQDVLGALRYLRERPDTASAPVGFVSFCMGANSTIVALASDAPEVEDVRFLVAVQPVSARVFISRFLRAQYTPLSLPLVGIVDLFLRIQGGPRLGEMSPVAYAQKVRVPVLQIQARDDRWTTVEDTEAIFAGFAGEKEMWWIEGIEDRFAAYDYVGDHPSRVIEFIERRMGGRPKTHV